MGLAWREGGQQGERGEREAREAWGAGQGEGRSQRREPVAAVGGTSLHGDDVWCHRGHHVRRHRGGWGEGEGRPGLAGRGQAAAVVHVVRHLHGEGGAAGGGEGARLAGAAGVVGALGGGEGAAARPGAEVGRAGVAVEVVMGVGDARAPQRAALQGEDGAVGRRRGGGLRGHLLIGGQLEGSQKTWEKESKRS